MTLLLALLALAQDTVTIPRSGREAYARNVPEAERAAGMIDSDPQGAIDILDPILDNAQIEKRECRIRWEVAPGTFSRYYEFLPYQTRGKAYLKLAEKVRDNPDKARGFLEKAVKDFTASKGRGIAASDELLKQAQLQVAGLAKPETTSREFDAEWGKLIDAGKFVEAKAILDSDKGKLLPADRRKAFLDDTNEKCRIFVDSAVQRFLRNLRQLSTPRQLEMMTPAGFDRDFSLPDRAALVESGLLPEYLWALSARPVLGDLRQKKDVLDPLLQIAVQSVPLAAKGDYDWFGGPEGLAHEIARNRISEGADAARTAPADRRKELRGEADKLEARWKKFEADARQAAAGQKKILDQLPSRSFAALLDRFPVDVAVGKETLQALLKTAEAPDPDRALSDILARLDQLGAGWEKLSVESRRELLRYRIAARALRGLLAGGPPDRVAAELRLEGADYKASGGAADEARFGSKVQKVFQLLVK
jgi:hypothetical protein